MSETLDDKLMEQKLDAAMTLRISGWPVHYHGLYMSCINNLQLVLQDSVDQQGFDRYIEESIRLHDATPGDAHIVALNVYHAGPWWNNLSLSERTQQIRRVTEMLTPRRTKINRVAAGSATCVDSALVRATIRTVLVLAPLGHPTTTVDKISKVWPFFNRCLPGFAPLADETRAMVHYIIRRYTPGLAHML